MFEIGLPSGMIDSGYRPSISVLVAECEVVELAFARPGRCVIRSLLCRGPLARLMLSACAVSLGTLSGLLVLAAPAGAVSFGSPSDYPTPDYPREAALGDFNRDSHEDVAVIVPPQTSGNFSGTVSVRLGDGSGALGAPTNVSLGYLPKAIADRKSVV